MSIIALSDFKGRNRIANIYGADHELPVVDITKAALDVKLIKGIISHEQHFLAKIELQDLIEKAEPSTKKERKIAKDWKLKKIEKAEDAQLIIKEIDELIKGGEGSRGGEVIGHTRSGKAIYKSGKHSDYKNFHEYDHEEAGHHHSQLADLHRQKSNAHNSLAKMSEYEKDKEGVKHYNNEKAESDKKEVHHAAQAQYHYEEARPQAHRDRQNKIGQMVADIRKK